MAHNTRSESEIDGIFARLQDYGANIVKQPQKILWGGYSGNFSDLDSHIGEIAYNPFWIIRTDGRVR